MSQTFGLVHTEYISNLRVQSVVAVILSKEGTILLAQTTRLSSSLLLALLPFGFVFRLWLFRKTKPSSFGCSDEPSSLLRFDSMTSLSESFLFVTQFWSRISHCQQSTMLLFLTVNKTTSSKSQQQENQEQQQPFGWPVQPMTSHSIMDPSHWHLTIYFTFVATMRRLNMASWVLMSLLSNPRDVRPNDCPVLSLLFLRPH